MALGKKKVKGGSEKSEIGIRYNLRISNPYGYYPEDTDRVIGDLEKQINNLQKENDRLQKEATKAVEDLKKMDREYQSLKLQVSLMEYPDTSAEQDSVMFGRLSTITGRDPQVEFDTPPIIGNSSEPRSAGLDDFIKQVNAERPKTIPTTDQIDFTLEEPKVNPTPAPVVEQPVEQPAPQHKTLDKKHTAINEDGLFNILEFKEG